MKMALKCATVQTGLVATRTVIAKSIGALALVGSSGPGCLLCGVRRAVFPFPHWRNKVPHAYSTNWYSGWGWFLWFAVMILVFASIGNWGYTYRVHRNYGRLPRKDALDILNERFARGEISSEEHARMKSTITAT